jgi:hypothetical protein
MSTVNGREHPEPWEIRYIQGHWFLQDANGEAIDDRALRITVASHNTKSSRIAELEEALTEAKYVIESPSFAHRDSDCYDPKMMAETLNKIDAALRPKGGQYEREQP